MLEKIEQLNAAFSITDQLCFEQGENGLLRAKFNNGLATAELYLHGAHITSFCPQGQDELLWMSPLAQFQEGKAIRGGIPIIWPWFGPHWSDKHKPQHGFARNSMWQVSSSAALPDGATQLQLVLNDAPETQSLWPHAFELRLCLTVGTTLNIELTGVNTGTMPFTAGAALHSYFALANVSEMFVEGLAGRTYIDQLDGHQQKIQKGTIRVTDAVDRIYVATDDHCVIYDEQASRKIQVAKTGSCSTVVWNPWAHTAKAMADFSSEGYRNMLCIETANAADDVRQLRPAESHAMSQTISLLK
jgi:glucose-6-phosphate 1-epimerase